ncbi:MAG TPA: DUF4012 domain-containing protein [Mycobacteriales bacterium]|nr:DUF4012 domain-containing protein [Mycobacteriales bacterium]
MVGQRAGPVGRRANEAVNAQPPRGVAEPPTGGTDPAVEFVRVRVRVRKRVSRQRLRRRRWVRRTIRIGLGVAVVLLLAGAWLALRTVQARDHLRKAQAAIVALRADLLSGDPALTRADLAAIQENARAAHHETSDPVWSVAGAIPGLGAPAHTVSGLADTVHTLAEQVLPSLVDSSKVMTPGSLPYANGTVDLAALDTLVRPLGAADARLGTEIDHVDGLSGSTFIPAVNRSRNTLLADVRQLRDTVHVASLTAQLAPSMLGANGPRNYFVAFQNNAEARATGGIVGAFGIMHADNGHISFTELGSDAQLDMHLPPVSAQGAASDRYDWRNANLSADFPAVARTYVALWQEQTGQRLDGAFATDPVALSYLLGATGPTRLPGGDVVTAQNVVSLSESQVYSRFPDVSVRKEYLQQISKATTDRVLAAPAAQAAGILKALQRAAAEHRLLLFSNDSGEQAKLADTSIAGTLPGAGRPTAVLALNNATASKLDYYTASSLTYSAGAGSCSATTRGTTVTIEVTNNAPRQGLPPFVLQTGGEAADGPPGTSVLLMDYYATTGAQLVSASQDGRQLALGVSTQAGHPVFSTPLTVGPGRSTRLVLQLTEPTGHGSVVTRPQPLVLPQHVTVHAPSCGEP